MSSAAHYRKDGQHVACRWPVDEFGVPGIDHQHSHFLPVYAECVDDVAHRRFLAYLSFFQLETVIAEVGEEFYCDSFHRFFT